MLATKIRERLIVPDFEPFTLVLASGEKIKVRHRDSLTLPSIEVRGVRIFSPYVIVLETKGEAVIDRVISLPLIAQIVDVHKYNGKR